MALSKSLTDGVIELVSGTTDHETIREILSATWIHGWEYAIVEELPVEENPWNKNYE